MKGISVLKIATWNVNSLNVRLEQVIAWMQESSVDILSLQETKVPDDRFPVQVFEELGFHIAFSGQKTYNGVAVISRHPMVNVLTDLPELDDPQRRILVVTIQGVRIINLYVPNGREVNSESYQYKLNWLEHVSAFIQRELTQHRNLAVMGDFNIAPHDEDVHDPAIWAGHVLVSPAERVAFNNLLALGLSDSFRRMHPEEQAYSWWDYRAGGFRRNHGLRIDHILLSEALQQRLTDSGIDREPRRAARPSDHAPVWVSVD